MPFAGLRVLSLESRRAKEMEVLIRKEEGEPFIAPSVQERALDDSGAALRFVEQLEADQFDMVICMTGTGLAFLRDQVVIRTSAERLGAALRRATILSRGPKPLPVLRELRAPAQIVIAEPNTWKEIVEAVAARPERRIAVQEYGRPNEEMNRALESLGAKVTPIVLYRWELPDDMEPLRAAARGLAKREFDVVLFTSSVQLDHLMMVADQLGLGSAVTAALLQYSVIRIGRPGDDCMAGSRWAAGRHHAAHPKMRALVKAAADLTATVILQKRAPFY